MSSNNMQDVGFSIPHVQLDITYEDPDLNSLGKLVNSGSSYDTSLRLGFSTRVEKDLGMLGIARPFFLGAEILSEAVLMQVAVCADENTLSRLDKDTAKLREMKITKVFRENKPQNAFQPVTGIDQYYRLKIGVSRTVDQPVPPLTLPQLPIPIDPNPGLVTHVPNGMRTPPESPTRPPLIRTRLMCPGSSYEDVAADIPPRILQARIAELQAAHAHEKREILRTAGELRQNFEKLLAQRMQELQADFNKKEQHLRSLIVNLPAPSQAESITYPTSALDPEESFAALLETTLRARRAEDKLAETEARVQALEGNGKIMRVQVREWEPQGKGVIEEMGNEGEQQQRSLTSAPPPCIHCSRTRRIQRVHVRAAELRAELLRRRLIEAESSVVELLGGLQVLKRDHKEMERGHIDREVLEPRQPVEAGGTEADTEYEDSGDEAPFFPPEVAAFLVKFDGIVDDIVCEV